MTKTDVARRIGVTPALISAHEKLERTPSIDKLVALADIFRVSTDYILGRTMQDENSVVVSGEGLSECGGIFSPFARSTVFTISEPDS